MAPTLDERSSGWAMICLISSSYCLSHSCAAILSKRRHTAAYKLRILDAADACQGTRGGIGRLLRSEGLYSGTLGEWRKAREAGILTGLSPQKRGVKPKGVNPFADKIRELEQDKIELEKRLEISQKIIEAQKKIAEIFTSLSQAQSNGKKS